MSIFAGYDPRNGRCAINECAITLIDEVQRAPTDLQFASQTSAPGEDPLRARSSPAGDRGRRRHYGSYEGPGLASAPITLPGQKVERATDVPVPKDVTGLYILLSVESRQQKLFASHVLDITGK